MADTGGSGRLPAGNLLTALAMIGGLLIQTAALVTWASKLDQRVATLEKKVEGNDKLAETVARIDERTAGLVHTVNRMADDQPGRGR